MVSSFDKGSKKISDGNASLPATISASQSESLSSSSPGSSSPIIVADITGIFNNIEEKYNIDDERIIGTGCYATVTECIERSSGQTYAVKSIRKSYAALKDTDIRREVDLLREMEHDNIVRLVDVYEDEEYLHLVTDRFTGGELYDRIIEKKKISGTAGCFPENEAAVILQQVLRALSYLHSHDICHRDIKPENIMFETNEDDSPVKLIDFGVARKHSKDSFEKYMSTVVGTSFFIAPEVLGERYDNTCDLWSLGVTAYVMLCGYPPFNGRSNREVCLKVKSGKYEFKSKYWKGVSKDAKDFVRKLLQVNPKKRMSIEQALNHPWIVKYNRDVKTVKEGPMQDKTCLDRRGSTLSFGGHRSLKLSIFSR